MNRTQTAPPPAKLTSNLNLKDRNTFGLDSRAEFAYEITAPEQLPPLIQELSEKKSAWRVLGGGSNVLLPKMLSGATLLMGIPGQAIVSDDASHTLVTAGAGVNWHAFVRWTLENALPSLENLALIPGTVGAAPIQNIGAYGLEVGEYIDSVTAFDTKTAAFVALTNDECQFAYRDSHLKQHPGRYIVTSVTFKIPKVWSPRLGYAELANAFGNTAITPTAKGIFEAVCAIRTRKLPDPNRIGNAGSFFHNPIISDQQCAVLSKQFPKLVSYPDTPGKRKLAAGWLIDQCGFKGQRMGSVGVYENQALVLVNHGSGTVDDIFNLANQIQEKVLQEFGVQLQIEPNIF